MAQFSKLACPHCSKPLKISQDLAGQTRKCPYCQGAVKIPQATVAPAAEAAPNFVVNENASPGQASAAPSRPAPRRRKKSWFQTSGDSASSDVSLVTSGLIGLGITIVWLIAMLPLRGYQFG